ncbi:MAG TPA: hypothetical protein VHM65_00815, partial [Candidatus Lustribacter sp.]|nr:hypothetical protein [Candidatus Lustribacter sp.]
TPASPEAPARPLTRAAALNLGLTPAQLRGPGFVRLFTNVYAPAGIAHTIGARAAGALLIAPPGSLAARHTAAALWGAPVPSWPTIELCIPRPHQMSSAGVRVSRPATLPQAATFQGIPVTTPGRTFLDCAESFGLVDLVVLGDYLVRNNHVAESELGKATAAWHRRGAELARQAAGLVRAGVDSPMETRLRLLLVLAGFPEPVVNHILRDDAGDWLYRLDLSYPQLRIAIEYDGRHHGESSAQWVKDVGRREALDNAGWRLMVVLSSDIYQHPARLLARAAQLLLDRGMPVTVRQDWRRYFPVR